MCSVCACFEHRLSVVGNRPVTVDRNVDGPHAEEAESNEAKREDRCMNSHDLDRSLEELPKIGGGHGSQRSAGPSTKRLKLPATSPERMVSEAPPSREAVTVFFAARSFRMRTRENLREFRNQHGCQRTATNDRREFPPECGIDCTAKCRQIADQQPAHAATDVVMHRTEAIQISRESGCSKSNSFRPLYFASEMYWLMK